MSILATVAMLQARNQTVTGITSANMIADTTIATVNTQTSFTLTAGSSADDAYNNFGIALRDTSDSNALSGHIITDYVGSTKTVTIDTTPGFTIVAGDGVKISDRWPETELNTASFPLVFTRKSDGTAFKEAGKLVSTDTYQIFVFLSKQHQDKFGESYDDTYRFISRFKELYTDPDPRAKTLQAKPSLVQIMNHLEDGVTDTGPIEIEFRNKVYYGFRVDVQVRDREL